ncbi:MAG: tRNA (guanosine(46)-N7)-methyltransferase TrmB [Spirochaetaceae bacterium]|jgi:tRNA (guanine-N7-)-methyltransferase|nr:tRNA (guanosine(46)-N7)-methyltransferase TrmB [Spirochaetaceae bacterium]
MTTSIKSYVMRGGRMSAAQERAYLNTAPQFCIPFSPQILDFNAVFGRNAPLVIEIGFGMGQALAEIAGLNPQVNYLGIEVFKAGVGKLLWEIETRHLSNIRIIEHDAVETLAAMVPDGSVSGFHLFFPDPWPKKRHHKRRLVQGPFVETLAAKLLPGGYIYFVSDWQEYADYACTELSVVQTLRRSPSPTTNAGIPPPRPTTKFETKALNAGRTITELVFTKHDG